MSYCPQHMASSPYQVVNPALLLPRSLSHFRTIKQWGFCFTFHQYITIENETHKSVINLLLRECTFSLGQEICMAQ